MIYIFLGDDTGESRKKFANFKNEFRQKGYEVIDLDSSKLEELEKWLADSQMLFSSKKVFFGGNLAAKASDRKILKKYDKDREVDIVSWEEALTEKEAKTAFPNARATVSKLPYNLFKFLDSVTPSNLKNSFELFSQVNDIVEENIILYMLEKRIRDLILIKKGHVKSQLADWQKARLASQASRWEETKLIKFYDALYRIEVLAKTGGSYYSIKKSLDILFCYYL